MRLEDRLHSPAVLRDVRINGITLPRRLLGVKVSFRAMGDADNPQLVKAEGGAGLGLRLTVTGMMFFWAVMANLFCNARVELAKLYRDA